MVGRSSLAWMVAAGCGFQGPAAGSDAPPIGPPSCTTAPDLAWWRLGTPGELDAIGQVPAVPFGTVDAIEDGPCGHALELGLSASIPYIIIDDRAAWDTIRRIDVWVRPTSAPSTGVLSRDAQGAGNGSLTLFEAMKDDGVTRLFALRLQRANPDETDLLCGPRAAAGTWSRIEISLGPPANELWIDGVLATETSNVTGVPGISTCGTSTIPITNSADPFVLGASAEMSTPGMADNLKSAFLGGALSNLRFFLTPRPPP